MQIVKYFLIFLLTALEFYTMKDFMFCLEFKSLWIFEAMCGNLLFTYIYMYLPVFKQSYLKIIHILSVSLG